MIDNPPGQPGPDATGQADAEATGRPLVGIVSIEEQSVSQSIRYDASNKLSSAMVAEAAATDGAGEVSTGEITTTANIIVTYELGK